MPFWQKPRIRAWHTHLSRHQCADRLASAQELICSIHRDDAFRLRKRKMWGYHNQFMPVLYGKLADDPVSGTQIEGYFGVSLLARLVLYYGLGICGIGFLMGVSGLFGHGFETQDLLAMLYVAGAGVAWVLVLALFWWIDSGDIGFMTEFLEQVLDAKPTGGELNTDATRTRR